MRLTSRIMRCNLWRDLNKQIRQKQKCNCTAGSLKAEIVPSRDYCLGTVKLYSNQRPYPICNGALTKGVQGSICKELDCGESESLEFLPHSSGSRFSVVAFDCPAANKSMANCKPSLEKSDCSEGRLRCSGTFSHPRVQGLTPGGF